MLVNLKNYVHYPCLGIEHWKYLIFSLFQGMLLQKNKREVKGDSQKYFFQPIQGYILGDLAMNNN